MTHRRIRDRVEDELFGRMAPKEENEDMAQTKRTRRIVEATKRLLMEDATLTTREIYNELSRNGASLPKLKSFHPYATQARAELGIDGRKAVSGHAQDPRGEDPAEASEAGANSPTPAPPADSEIDTPVTSLQGRKEIQEPTPKRPSNEAQMGLERDSAEMLDDVEEAERLAARGAAAEEASRVVVSTPAARSRSTYERPRPRTEGGNVEYMRIRNGEVLVKASGPLEWVKAMVAALPEEGGER